jgi:hypothetical protein
MLNRDLGWSREKYVENSALQDFMQLLNIRGLWIVPSITVRRESGLKTFGAEREFSRNFRIDCRNKGLQFNGLLLSSGLRLTRGFLASFTRFPCF